MKTKKKMTVGRAALYIIVYIVFEARRVQRLNPKRLNYREAKEKAEPSKVRLFLYLKKSFFQKYPFFIQLPSQTPLQDMRRVV